MRRFGEISEDEIVYLTSRQFSENCLCRPTKSCHDLGEIKECKFTPFPQEQEGTFVTFIKIYQPVHCAVCIGLLLKPEIFAVHKFRDLQILRFFAVSKFRGCPPLATRLCCFIISLSCKFRGKI